MTVKPTQRDMDIAVVQGWHDCAVAAGETLMVEFYTRLLAALKTLQAVQAARGR